MNEYVKEGWVKMPNAKKVHYIRVGHALCCRWMFLGKIFADDQISQKQLPDDCKGCWAKLQQEPKLTNGEGDKNE